MHIYTFQQKSGQSKNPKRKKFNFKLKGNYRKILIWLFRLAALGVLALALLFLYYSKDLPDPNKLLSRNVPESTQIYAKDGTLLYEIHGDIQRTLVNLDQIPDNVKNATIAIEDKNFHTDKGISLTGIARSVLTDIFKGQKASGGSTITQQFVKNAVLTNEKTYSRKLKEIFLSLEIEARLSKNQILQLYLNEIPYGGNAYGVQAASQVYFGKPVQNLDLAESAYLAAMIQAPTHFNPLGPNRAALDNRKNVVLSLMQQQGYITADQQQQAKDEKVEFSKIKSAISAPHFVLWVENYLAQKYGETRLEEGGLKVYTTLDPHLQQIAEQVIKDDVTKEKKYNVGNAALVAIDPKTGQILAMVGSKDYFGTAEPAGCIPGQPLSSGKSCTFEPNVNVAVSQRQPGSSFKPYVYATAFKKEFKYYPAHPIFDLVTNFGTFGGKDYIPHNYDGTTHGLVSMRQALAGSLNIPAVKTLALVGVDNAVQTARDLGITSPLQNCGLSLVLGGCEVTLLDHVAAFSTIANEGVKNAKTPIRKIIDKNGATLEQYQANPQQVLDPQDAYELISIMTDNNARAFVFGSHSPLILPDRTVAAKTGTTQNWHDGWTVGFTPSLAAGVWTGNNDGNYLKKNADGVIVAAPIWHDFMVQALAGTPPEEFAIPSGIQKITVDQQSGKLPTQNSPSTLTDVFADYAVPTDFDNVHTSMDIDATTGLPATSLTDPANVISKAFTILHSEKPDNPNWEGPVRAWAATQGYEPPPTANNPLPTEGLQGKIALSIISPEDGDTISQLPFMVNVSAASANTIARMDLYLDGQLFKSLSSAPFVFQVDKQLGEGQHTIAAKAVDSSGQTGETSLNITIAMQGVQITITDPSGGQLNFPQTITAESNIQYGQVNFYYQLGNSSPKLLGPASNISHVADKYDYSIIWDSKPQSGSYRLYVQTNNNITSPKIKVFIP